MKTSTHYYERRNSASAPYTIPAKQHHHHFPHPQSEHTAHQPAQHISREFVARRISEGETGRLKEGLKCESCGKSYKHISSLAKHLWEHTPEWNVTKKLLLSKHQQVQLLEAASILVGMNEPVSASSRRGSVFGPVDEDDENEPPHHHHQTHYNHRSVLKEAHSVSPSPDNSLLYAGSSSVGNKTHRSDSSSRYPPSADTTSDEPGVPSAVLGGYLDTSAAKRVISSPPPAPFQQPPHLAHSSTNSPDSSTYYSSAEQHAAVFSPSPAGSTNSSPKAEPRSESNSIDEISTS